MMDFRGWTFPTPDSMYAPTNSSSPFATNVSSYFHRPAKIVKTNSRNASPRHSGRQRTTSNVPSRTRSLLDKQRISLQRQLVSQQNARPLSWHPETYPAFGYTDQSMPAEVTFNQYPQLMYGTGAVNGLVTPMAYPMADEPQIQELISPLEELSAQEVGTHFDAHNPYSYQYWMDSEMSKQQAYAMDQMFAQQQMTTQPWPLNLQYTTADLPTTPASPSFLPIQGGGEVSTLNLDTRPGVGKHGGDELVGMGLYDSPADVQSSLLFGGGLYGVGRKRSLKLEESFEPAPESSDAEGEDGVNEENDDGEEEEEEAEEEEDSMPAEHALHQHQTMRPAPSMAGQSFFFDAESNHPTVPHHSENMGFVPNAQFSTYGWV